MKEEQLETMGSQLKAMERQFDQLSLERHSGQPKAWYRAVDNPQNEYYTVLLCVLVQDPCEPGQEREHALTPLRHLRGRACRQHHAV